jgi:hypothetical protein
MFKISKESNKYKEFPKISLFLIKNLKEGEKWERFENLNFLWLVLRDIFCMYVCGVLILWILFRE